MIDALGLLLRAGPDQLDTAIVTVLHQLGTSVGADRVILCTRHVQGWRLTHQWHAPTAAAVADCLAGASILDLVDDPTLLTGGNPLVLPDIAAMPDWPLRRLMEASGVRAMAVIPLLSDDEVSGLIGIQRLAAPGGFDETGLWMARALSDGLNSALARRRAEAERDAARASQAETLERLRATLAAMPELMLEMDSDGRCLDYHTAAPELLAVRPEAVLGRTLEETLPPKIARLQRATMAKALTTGTAKVPLYALTHEGVERWYETIIVHRRLNGEDGFIFRIRDVTAERQRDAENAMLVEVTRNMTNLAMLLDNEGRVIWTNPAAERVSGWRLVDMRGQRLSAMADPSSDPAAIARLGEALDTRGSCRVELAGRRRDGSPYWVDLWLQPLDDAAGQPQGFLAIKNDITALKRHERELERLAIESEQAHSRLHAALEVLQDGFALFDAEDRMVLSNERYRSFFPGSAEMMAPGVLFEDFLRHALAAGEFRDAVGR